MVETLKPNTASSSSDLVTRDEAEPLPLSSKARASVVYLSADSPHTLERLEPHTCYVIGGIVDKNREKGLCERLAVERGVRTAKLPIGEYMVMQSRQVLATNHVVEILSNWLECGDWASSFFKVIPKRKGGVLREQASEPQASAGETNEVENGAAVNGEGGPEAAVDQLDSLEAAEGESSPS
jgi:tRNA (guanine9-N1)-methyltransferase